MKTFLHVGCGPVKKSQIPGFKENDWAEIRFDIDKNVNPDIEGTLTDMSQVETGSVDAIYSCLLYTSPSPRDRQKSRMPSSA